MAGNQPVYTHLQSLCSPVLLLQNLFLCSGFCNGKAHPAQDSRPGHMFVCASDSSFLKLNALGISDLTLDVKA